jgi:hypothetical protein
MRPRPVNYGSVKPVQVVLEPKRERRTIGIRTGHTGVKAMNAVRWEWIVRQIHTADTSHLALDAELENLGGEINHQPHGAAIPLIQTGQNLEDIHI